MNTPITIKQLSNIIQSNLPIQKFTVEGEVSKPKSYNGHLFFGFKDNKSTVNGKIWSSTLQTVNQPIKDGDNLIVEGSLNYYGTRGDISLIISKLIKHNGIGHLFRLCQKNKLKFQEKGYFDDSNKLPLPDVIKNILILTSANGDAIQDFFHVLKDNGCLLKNKLINVSVQGNNCPKDICFQLNQLEEIYDLIVITRGGGSFEDLFGFCKPKLIETVYLFNQPVLSAIGHKKDNTLLDLVADVNAPTPSLAGQFIVDHNKNYLKKLNNIKTDLQSVLRQNILEQNKSLNKLKEKLNYHSLFLKRIQMTCQNKILNYMHRYQNGLVLLLDRLKKMSEIGEHVELYFKDKPIKNINFLVKILQKGKKLKIRFGENTIIFKDYQYSIELKN